MEIWNVGDIKASHKQLDDITKLVSWLMAIYGNIKVGRGKKHYDLGMDFY